MRRLTELFARPSTEQPSQSPTTPLQHPWRQAIKRWIRRGMIVGVTLVIIVGGLGFIWARETGRLTVYQAHLEFQVDRFLQWVGFELKSIELQGRVRTPHTALQTALGYGQGDPLLSIDPHHVQARLQDLPWVRHAMVERRWPSTLFIRLEERSPYALWQQPNQQTVLIDATGHPIRGVDLQEFENLLTIVGDQANLHAIEIKQILAQAPSLQDRVFLAIYISKRRWTIQLKSGLQVHLPQGNAGRAWSYLATLDKRDSVLDRNIIELDLRLPDRAIVRTQTAQESILLPRPKPPQPSQP